MIADEVMMAADSMFVWRPALYDFLQKVFKPTDGP
jgi:hypothetical protein